MSVARFEHKKALAGRRVIITRGFFPGHSDPLATRFREAINRGVFDVRTWIYLAVGPAGTRKQDISARRDHGANGACCP
jgi:hypothetical protein